MTALAHQMHAHRSRSSSSSLRVVVGLAASTLPFSLRLQELLLPLLQQQPKPPRQLVLTPLLLLPRRLLVRLPVVHPQQQQQRQAEGCHLLAGVGVPGVLLGAVAGAGHAPHPLGAHPEAVQLESVQLRLG